MMIDVTGIILAGGKNSRMGRDKAFMPFSGRPLIETIMDRFSTVFDDIMIITNSPHLYENYDIETCTDVIKGRGPLGGIYTGLLVSGSKYIFVTACDMPFINEGVMRYMLDQANNHDAVVVKRGGKVEPFCALYSVRCVPFIKEELNKNNLKLADLLEKINVRYVHEGEIKSFDPEEHSFININTEEDYKWILQDSLTLDRTPTT